MTTYLTDSDGKFIPATQRPDGTWRKARRVKDGYVPQEEVPLYESKGKQFAQRKSTLPPGMCPLVAEQTKKEREKLERAKAKKAAKQQEITETSKSNNSGTSNNKKVKQTQSQTQQIPGFLVLPNNGTPKATDSKVNTSANKTSSTNNNDAVVKLASDLQATLQLQADEGLDTSKKLKKLRKKLREIETIEQRIKSGELKKPEKDQLDKVKRKKEVIKEIKQLEEEEEALM
ncbi:partner of Y14 and mago [Zeugodacus cucurbitae]|uniref:partner of Y14 and mago n=1 Tax=Zeugodacus cucurbitae TaxID=28588 RepID=UPI0023D9463A|nr:partner of Y14 and mago [Zeugodacus cucurbitae]